MMDKFMIFEAIGEIDDAYILEVDRVHVRSYSKIWRTALIAALIAAAFTVTAYATGLFGLQSRILPHGESGVRPTENVTDYTSALRKIHSRDYISLGGVTGTPEYEAAAEWMAFKHEYLEAKGNDDSWRDYGHSFAENDTQREICTIYGAEDKQMLFKLLEIANSYGLELHTEKTYYNSGFLSIEKPIVYENGSYSFTYHGKKEDNHPGYTLYFEKPGTISVNEISVSPDCEFSEWDYTNSFGYAVSIAFASYDGGSEILIFASGDSGEVTVHTLSVRALEYEDAEAIADSIDFACLFANPDITGASDSIGKTNKESFIMPVAAVPESDENITITLPASGESPDGSAGYRSEISEAEMPATMPLVKAKYKMIDTEIMRSAVDVLLGDCVLYEGGYVNTKDDINREIADLNETITYVELHGAEDGLTEADIAAMVSTYQRELEDLYTQYTMAPENAEANKEFMWKFWGENHYFGGNGNDPCWDEPQHGMVTVSHAYAMKEGNKYFISANNCDYGDYKTFGFDFNTEGVDPGSYGKFKSASKATDEEIEAAVSKIRSILHEIGFGDWVLRGEANEVYERIGDEVKQTGWFIRIYGSQRIAGYPVISTGDSYGFVMCDISNDGHINMISVVDALEATEITNVATSSTDEIAGMEQEGLDFWSIYKNTWNIYTNTWDYTRIEVDVQGAEPTLEWHDTADGIILSPAMTLYGNTEYYNENGLFFDNPTLYQSENGFYAYIKTLPLVK